MTEPTPSLIKNRIVTMCALVSGIALAQDAWPDEDTMLTDDQVPAVIVDFVPPMGSDPLDAQLWLSSQNFNLTLLAKRFPADYKLRDQTTLELTEPYFQRIPSYFNQHRGLLVSGVPYVKDTTLPALQSLGPLAYGKALYAAAVFRMTVYVLYS